MNHDKEEYLKPTDMIDSDNETIIQYAQANCGPNKQDHLKMAIHLYNAVRDDIRYNPYSPFWLPEHFRASVILKKKNGLCIGKAVLLCAVGRACGIPSRLGYADVINHLTTQQLINTLGSSNFVYHSFTEFYLEGKWVKSTPAFDKAACKRHFVEPLEFNGLEDSLYHMYNKKKQLFMEYIEFHGSRSDVPLDEIVNAFTKEYGKDRIDEWIEEWNQFENKLRDFYAEDVIDEVITV